MRKVITNSVGMEQVFVVPEGCESMVEDVYVKGGYDCHVEGSDLDILDIGANVGSFSLWALKRFPGSRIVSYEPVKETYDCLVENTKFYKSISCFNLAVSTAKELEIKVNKDRYFLSGNGFNHAKTDLVETRLVPTINPYSLPKADIVKIDTEGSEVDIVENMHLSWVSLIMIEIHSNQDYKRLSAYFANEGFFLWHVMRYHHEDVGEFVFANEDQFSPNIRSLFIKADDFKDCKYDR